MGYETKNGYDALVQRSVRGAVIDTAIALAPNTWHEVLSRGAASALPAGFIEGAPFKTPDSSATAITLTADDAVYPLTFEIICKTDVTIDGEEGVIDVTDDCESGYNAVVLDGYVDLKGSLGGYSKMDDATGVWKDDTLFALQKFFDYATDDGEGVYVFTAKANEKLMLFICLNKDAVVGEKQNWLITPALISSLSMGAGLKAAQKRDLSWAKAQGPAIVYARTVFTDDVL